MSKPPKRVIVLGRHQIKLDGFLDSVARNPPASREELIARVKSSGLGRVALVEARRRLGTSFKSRQHPEVEIDNPTRLRVQGLFRKNQGLLFTIAQPYLRSGISFQEIEDYVLERSLARAMRFKGKGDVEFDLWVTSLWKKMVLAAVRNHKSRYSKESSLDSNPEAGDTSRLLRVLVSSRELPPDIILSEKERKKRLALVLNSLTPIEGMVIDRRYGLSSGTPLEYRQIGAEMGISHEKVRQVELRTLEKLRKKMQGY
ncbi:MAG: sigma-70 family RNA polymerase sigma factor [Candidatus Micrarchaeota archaeon]